MDATYPLRLDDGRREDLEAIGKPYHMSKAALIRLAVDQLIAATKANGGQLPAVIEEMRHNSDHHEAALAIAGGTR